MILRKINAGLSIICTILLMAHANSHAAWMLSNGSIKVGVKGMSWALVWVMAAHAILSIVLAILGHKGAEKRKCNTYPQLNVQTNLQRMSGMLLILFTALHVAGTVGVLQPPKVVHAILPPLFFAMSLMHVAVSGSKALITLGIGNAKVVKVVDIVVKVLCIITLIASVSGFYLYSV